jgi:hypothetical protein
VKAWCRPSTRPADATSAVSESPRTAEVDDPTNDQALSSIGPDPPGDLPAGRAEQRRASFGVPAAKKMQSPGLAPDAAAARRAPRGQVLDDRAPLVEGAVLATST